MFAREAKGALLTDVDGNTFIDFGGGIGVMNVGHTDSRVVEAVKAQVERLTHSCFYVTEYEGYLRASREAERDGAGRHGEAVLLRQLRG